MKTIVTHMAVDLDAVTSTWLVQRYIPGWQDASYRFVPAGTTLGDRPPDEDPNITHTDTGLGRFDHHQFADKNQSATRRVFDYLVEKGHVKEREIPALVRIVDYVTLIDHFGEFFLPEPNSDIYDFSIHELPDGLRALNMSDEEIMKFVMTTLDGTLEHFKKKVNAESEIKLGFIFENKWGKALAMETQNEETLKMALKQGYKTVARKNPKNGFIRIKTAPEKEIDLTPVYEAVLKEDPKATWFLHVGKHMLLNGSSKNPNAVASSLTLKKVIEILSQIN